jgi:hypothetical protein
MADGVPSEETLGVARREVERAKEALAAVRGDAGWKEGTRFRKPEGESATAHFHDLKLELYNELQGRAMKANVVFPKRFELGAAEDPQSEDLARELLLRLAAVERVVLLALDAGVERIDLIDPLYGAESKDQAVTKKGTFLNAYSVLMKFAGRSEAVFKVLHGVQKKGEYFAVPHFEAVRVDPSKDLFAASIAVSLIRVDEKAPIEPKPENQE